MLNNRILKKIGNRTINKFIIIKLKFSIYKSLIFFHAINQYMNLIFNFVRTIKNNDANHTIILEKSDGGGVIIYINLGRA